MCLEDSILCVYIHISLHPYAHYEKQQTKVLEGRDQGSKASLCLQVSAYRVNGTKVGWWAEVPWSSPFFPVLVPATWAAMSYPDISAVILDASFDDLVPLALKVMPDSWSECSSQACLSREGVGWNWELF